MAKMTLGWRISSKNGWLPDSCQGWLFKTCLWVSSWKTCLPNLTKRNYLWRLKKKIPGNGQHGPVMLSSKQSWHFFCGSTHQRHFYSFPVGGAPGGMYFQKLQGLRLKDFLNHRNNRTIQKIRFPASFQVWLFCGSRQTFFKADV